MMFVVYHNNPGDSYPTMLGVFLFKCDAVDFANSQTFSSIIVEEVAGTWGYWNMIREKLNEQVYHDENEEC